MKILLKLAIVLIILILSITVSVACINNNDTDSNSTQTNDNVNNNSSVGNTNATENLSPFTYEKVMGSSLNDYNYAVSGLKNTYKGEENLEIPAKIGNRAVVEIRKNAFLGNKTIKSIKLPEGITRIGEFAFAETNIKTINVPSTVDYIELGAFAGTNAFIENESNRYFSMNGSLFENVFEYGGILHSCILMNAYLEEESSTFEIPDFVTTLGRYSLYNQRITQIINGSNVMEVQPNTFYSVDNFLKGEDSCFVLGKTLIRYFEDEEGSQEIFELPTTIERIYSHAFKDTSIKEIRIKGDVELYDKAFADMKKLEKTIIERRMVMGSEVFKGCDNLKEVIFLANGCGGCGDVFAGKEIDYEICIPMAFQESYLSQNCFKKLKESNKLSYVQVQISFDSQGGSICESVKNHYFNEFDNLPIPQRDHYVFLGWYNQQHDGERYDNGKLCEELEDLKLYARWTLKTYSASLSCDLCSFSQRERYNIESENLSLSSLNIAHSHKGYDFNDWYYEGEAISTLPFQEESDATIKAIFTPKIYSVKLIEDKDNPSIFTIVNLTYGEHFELYALEGIREEIIYPESSDGDIYFKATYVFAGWEYIEENQPDNVLNLVTDNKGKSRRSWDVAEDDIALYASWELDKLEAILPE